MELLHAPCSQEPAGPGVMPPSLGARLLARMTLPEVLTYVTARTDEMLERHKALLEAARSHLPAALHAKMAEVYRELGQLQADLQETARLNAPHGGPRPAMAEWLAARIDSAARFARSREKDLAGTTPL